MKSIMQAFFLGVLAMLLTLFIGCSPADQSGAPVDPSTPASSGSTAVESASSDQIKFKRDDGSEVFSLKLMSDGAKLVDANDAELARLTVDANQKVKIKNASDQTLGYVVTHSGYWKLENADQSQELFILRRQDDGDYKLEDGGDQQVYRIKAREYGYEIETPDKQSLYKVKVRDGKISLRNADDETVLSTRNAIAPIAIAPFGFDVLSREQQAGLAFAVNRSGGR